MPFETARPVTGSAFFDRQQELQTLLKSAQDLLQGKQSYYAIIGFRKIGKSSLLWEFERHLPESTLSLHLDCWEIRLNPYAFFHEFVKQLVNSYLIKSGDVEKVGYVDRLASLSQGLDFSLTLARLQLLGLESLNRAATALRLLERQEYSYELFDTIIDLPQTLAEETNRKCVVIIDEFQELKSLERFKVVKEHVGDLFAFLRGHWQRHDRVNYVVGGSKITLLRNLLLDANAPFFQHFRLLDLQPFSRQEAVALLSTFIPEEGKTISPVLCHQIVDLVGTNPFYLQVVGEELCTEEPTEEITPLTLKIVLQKTLFDNTGRLNLYFQRLLSDIIGKSSSLESILFALIEDKRITDIAQTIHVDSGTASNWLGRLLREDIVIKQEDGTYTIPDPGFRLWLKSRSDIQTVLPPLVLGSETEKLVARQLMAQGIRLVYHAQASRGSFDLLALMNGEAIGLQCKKADLPYYLPQQEYEAMQAWAQKLGWMPILALNVQSEIRFYKLDDLQATERHYRVDNQTPSFKSLLVLL